MEFNQQLLNDISSGKLVVIDNKNYRNTLRKGGGGRINSYVRDLLEHLAPTHYMSGNGTYYLFNYGKYWRCVPDLDCIPKGTKYITYTSLEIKAPLNIVEEC